MQVDILILMAKLKTLRFIIDHSQIQKFLKIINLFQAELAYKMMAYHNMVIKEIKYKDLPSQFCVFKDAIDRTPLACFLSQADCEKWISENGK